MPISATTVKPQQETVTYGSSPRKETDLRRAGRLVTAGVKHDPEVLRNCTTREARQMIHVWLRPIVARARSNQRGVTTIKHHEMFDGKGDDQRLTRHYEIFRSVMEPDEHSEPDSAHEAMEAFVLRGDEISFVYTCSEDPEHHWARITLIQGE